RGVRRTGRRPWLPAGRTPSGSPPWSPPPGRGCDGDAALGVVAHPLGGLRYAAPGRGWAVRCGLFGRPLALRCAECVTGPHGEVVRRIRGVRRGDELVEDRTGRQLHDGLDSGDGPTHLGRWPDRCCDGGFDRVIQVEPLSCRVGHSGITSTWTSSTRRSMGLPSTP